MNIQLSVIIWTVICFSLLMLILSNWLLRPVLKVIDERNKKLDAARSKKKEYEELAIAQKEEFENKELEYIEQQKAQAKATVAQIQADEKTQLKLAHSQSLENTDAYREELEANHEQIVEALSPQMKEIAEIFAQQIISYRT